MTQRFANRAIEFPKHPSVNDFLRGIDLLAMKRFWKNNGYVVVKGLVPKNCLPFYQTLYNKMHSGDINCSDHRIDLGGYVDMKVDGKENMGQIMWPSLYVKNLANGPLHTRALAVARELIGDDAVFDFDMLIFKDGKTETSTPWHQDEAYWPKGMTDKRACSNWVALDDVFVENGCMWFVPGSHLESEIRPHRKASPAAHALLTDDCTNDEGTPVPLDAGDCTFHHGRTLHYAGGNITDKLRRAYITAYRPEQMVKWEREHGFDHVKEGWDTYDPATGGEAGKL